MNKHVVKLTDTQRQELEACINKGKSEAYKIKHANILLKADVNGPGETDEKIADAYNCHTRTVANVRKRFATEGFARALGRAQREVPPTPRKLDGEAETRLIALSCGDPQKVLADGRCVYLRQNWSGLRL